MQNKQSVDSDRTMFETRISAGAMEKLPSSGKKPEHLYMVPTIWTVMQRNAWSDIAIWPTKQLSTSIEFSVPCLDDHQLREVELNSAGKLSKVCSRIVLKCQFLARTGRADIVWSVNKLACDHKMDQSL